MKNFIKFSKCKNYILSETKIYSVELNESLDLNETSLEFWLNIIKKNSVYLYEQKKMSIFELNKLINETMFTLERIFDDNKFIFEYSFFKKQIVLSEEFDRTKNSNLISESWDFIINYQNKFISNLIQEEESWWDKTKKFGSKLYSKVKEKVSSAVDWVKSKGIGFFFEGLRKALMSWGGAAVQAFLATAGSAAFGLGPTINFITWAAMLGYDLYLGISQNQWNWINIFIDLLGALTAGPGAKIAAGLFKGMGLLGKGAGAAYSSIKNLVTAMMKSKAGSTAVTKIFKPIVNGIGTIVKYLSQAANWLSTKLGIPFLKQKFGQIKSWVDKIAGEISTVMSQSKTVQNIANVATQGAKGTSNLVTRGAKGASNLVTRGANAYRGMSNLGKATVSAAAMGGAVAGVNALSGGDNKVLAGAWQDPSQEELSTQYAELQNVDWSKAELPPEDVI
jgi:hypothetical protein